jgi:P27 family predicted phage terminase small subunit
MTRGRKPKPRPLRILEGNPGKRTLPPAIIPTGKATMPPHLARAAKKEWRRVITELQALGLATSLDRAALAGYCQSWARWVEAEEQLKKYGTIIKSPTGFIALSPYVMLAQASLKQMREFLVEFGMSPSARTRVKPDETRAPAKATGTDGKAPGRFFRE